LASPLVSPDFSSSRDTLTFAISADRSRPACESSLILVAESPFHRRRLHWLLQKLSSYPRPQGLLTLHFPCFPFESELTHCFRHLPARQGAIEGHGPGAATFDLDYLLSWRPLLFLFPFVTLTSISSSLDQRHLTTPPPNYQRSGQ